MLKIAWTEEYSHNLPENHRFPMIKYELIPQQLLHEGIISSKQIFAPGLLSEEDILAVHDPGYWQKLKNLELSKAEERRTGFPLSEQLVTREKRIAQGTIECSLFALQYGVSMNIAGGTHHAFTDRGEGFCLLNDIAVGASYLLRKALVKRILVIDLDVHQGNGTAQIFRDTPEVFTFSMHGEKNFPHKKESSDLDVELRDGINDEEYLHILRKHLPTLFDKVRPELVYFQSGVDVLETDALGRLNLTMNGCKERDRLVLSMCRTHDVPVVAVMGGGYSPQIRDIIEAHVNTFRLATELYF